MFRPEHGDTKTVNGLTYLNPWINYTVPRPILVGSAFCYCSTVPPRTSMQYSNRPMDRKSARCDRVSKTVKNIVFFC